jgi:hypothetical protein
MIEVADQSPPSAIWVSPVADGEIYDVMPGEMVPLEVEVADNVGVSCVDFSRWDAVGLKFILIGTDCQAPFTQVVDADTLNYGFNQTYVRAYDSAGNWSDFNHIWLYRAAWVFLPLAEK